MTEGLVWVEAYLPFDPESFAAFAAKARELGSAVAAATADPALAAKALDPIDAHGEAMLLEDLALLAHTFLVESRKIDVMHDEAARSSVRVVESFVNTPEVASPNYYPGAWVVVLKIDPGSPEWAEVEKGAIDAVSFQAFVKKVPVTIALQERP